MRCINLTSQNLLAFLSQDVPDSWEEAEVDFLIRRLRPESPPPATNECIKQNEQGKERGEST